MWQESAHIHDYLIYQSWAPCVTWHRNALARVSMTTNRVATEMARAAFYGLSKRSHCIIPCRPFLIQSDNRTGFELDQSQTSVSVMRTDYMGHFSRVTTQHKVYLLQLEFSLSVYTYTVTDLLHSNYLIAPCIVWICIRVHTMQGDYLFM